MAYKYLQALLTSFILLLTISDVNANDKFTKGPVIKNYGENAVIEGGLNNAGMQKFKVLFDVSESTGDGGINRNFNTVARFINMHVRAGVPLDNLDVAIVVHGKASNDLMSNPAYQAKLGEDNPNTELLEQLLDANVRILVCGQSASYHEIEAAALSQGVEMSLSAMTANALLQQQGYTLNPF